jgi:hypothetical protein
VNHGVIAKVGVRGLEGCASLGLEFRLPDSDGRRHVRRRHPDRAARVTVRPTNDELATVAAANVGMPNPVCLPHLGVRLTRSKAGGEVAGDEGDP